MTPYSTNEHFSPCSKLWEPKQQQQQQQTNPTRHSRVYCARFNCRDNGSFLADEDCWEGDNNDNADIMIIIIVTIIIIIMGIDVALSETQSAL